MHALTISCPLGSTDVAVAKAMARFSRPKTINWEHCVCKSTTLSAPILPTVSNRASLLMEMASPHPNSIFKTNALFFLPDIWRKSQV